MACMLMTAWDGWGGAKPAPNLSAMVELQKQRLRRRSTIIPSLHLWQTAESQKITSSGFESCMRRDWKEDGAPLEVQEGAFLSIYILLAPITYAKLSIWIYLMQAAEVTFSIISIHAKERGLIKSCPNHLQHGSYNRIEGASLPCIVRAPCC